MNNATLTPATLGVLDNLQGGPQAAQHASQHPCGDQQQQTAPAAFVPDQIAWPPGFAGQLASFVYASSARPVREVAIVAALGVLAGVCGRAFTISEKGLNLYVLLVARSAVGKEAMHSGIVRLLDLASNEPAQRFADFDEFVSAPALGKGVLQNPSFVNVVGEVGRKFKRMNRDSDKAMQELRTVWTNLYEKSGAHDKVPGLRYSKAEDSAKGLRGVAYSLIGETTPGTFLESLTPDMAADGFLSRFTIIEYDGPRPPLNDARAIELEPEELEKWRQLLIRALPYGDIVNTPPRIEVGYEDEEVMRKLHQFSLHCDDEVNSTDNEWRRQMWSRAHMKALKIAALLACADECVLPKINYKHAAWALYLVRRDIDAMATRLKNGDVGNDDQSREKKLLSIMVEYLKEGAKPGYKIPAAMRENSIIPRKFLQIRVSNINTFSGHKLGANVALDLTVRSMVDSGYIMEVDKSKMVEAYGSHGKCFRILATA